MDDKKLENETETEENCNDTVLGEPVALTINCELYEEPKIVIKCDCGKPFRLSLAEPAIKICPGCGARFSHALLIAHADDPDAIDDLMDLLESSNNDESEQEQPEEAELAESSVIDESEFDEQE